MQSKYDLEKAFAMFDHGHILREVAGAIGAPMGSINWIKDKWRNTRAVENAVPPHRKPLTPAEQAKADLFWAEWEDACERREARDHARMESERRTKAGLDAERSRARAKEKRRRAAQAQV